MLSLLPVQYLRTLGLSGHGFYFVAEANRDLVQLVSQQKRSCVVKGADLVLELLAPACARGVGDVVASRTPTCKSLFQVENWWGFS